MHNTMGWNPTHKLDDDDWNEIRKNGVDEKFRNLLEEAKKTAYLAEGNPELLKSSLSDLMSSEVKRLTN